MTFANPLTIPQLIDIIKQEVSIIGNNDNLALGINEIHSVEKGDVSFVDSSKYYNKVLQSAATIILIDKEVECPKEKTLLVCEDPLRAYLDIVNQFVAFNPQKQAIHPDAIIGEGTIIQPNVFIGENVVIGKNCIIHSNVSIYADTTIGNNVVIHSGCVIGSDACYFQKRDIGWLKLDSCGGTIIGDDVEIGSNCCIDKGVSGDTFIGQGTKFDNLVQIGHDTYIGAHCFLGSQSAIAGCSRIDDHCTIWAKSAVNKDLYLAKNTTVLAISAVDKSVNEEGMVLFGAPAEDARKKWKEMASIRMLPEIIEEFKKIKRES